MAGNPFTIPKVMKRHDNTRARFTVWHTHWQLIAEWLFTRKASFTGTVNEAEFLDREMFNMTGPLAMNLAASAFLGLVWPGGADSFDIYPADDLADDIEAQEYFAWATSQVADAMDDPDAGLDNALSEYSKELFAFGNGAVSVTTGISTVLRYDSRSLRSIVFDEGTLGKVDVIFDKPDMTVEQAAHEYGLEALHPNIRKAYDQGSYDQKVDILHAIMPRPPELRKGPRASKKAMPYASLHIDVANKHLMKEDGFEEPPIIVGRMERYASEIPGRGPGGRALPEIVKANAIEEALMLAAEKKLEPPLYVWSDLRNTVIDKSAGAVNVFRPKGQVANNAPAGELFTVGSMQEALALLERAEANIKSHFYLDRLLDLSEQVMTAYQTATRNILRAQTMKDPTKRQYSEFFTPLITRSFNIMWRAGKLGAFPGTAEYEAAKTMGRRVVPESVAKVVMEGNNAWKIRYKTPAVRDAKAQAVQNNIQGVQALSLMANAFQDSSILMIGDGKEIARDTLEGLGIVSKGIRSKKQVDEAMKQVEASEQANQAAQAEALAASAAAGGQLTGEQGTALKVIQGGAQQARNQGAA